MAKRKKKKSAARQWLAELAAAGSQISPNLVLAAFVVLLIVVGVAFGWQRWGSDALARADRRLQSDAIHVTNQPAWIQSEVAAEVFRNGSLGKLSLLDNELTFKVYKAFMMHPWVADVDRVGKNAGGSVVVKLKYRRPVALVEIPAEMTPFDEPMPGILPIDREAVLLPVADLKGRLDRFPLIRIVVPNPHPWGLAGTAWGDPRITSAARIADLLADSWRELGLVGIRLGQSAAGDGSPPIFELVTQDRTALVWGSAPGEEQPGELSAAEKLNRLRQELQQGGLSLRPSLLDLRTAQPPSAQQRR